jgi:amino acid adenylation domain-containing protein
MTLDGVSALLRLSPVQEDLLALTSTQGASSPAQLVYRILGRLSTERLQDSWRDVVAKYPALRTSIHWEGLSKPVQAVRKTVDATVDCRGYSMEPGDRNDPCDDYCSQQRDRAFDPTHAPLHRMALLQLEEEKFLVVLTYDELILDPNSGIAVMAELLRTYASHKLKESELADIFGRRSDVFAERGADQDTERASVFWSNYLRDFSGSAGAGLDQDHHNGKVVCEHYISDVVSERLRQMARELSCSLSTILVAAWGLLLGRRERTNDVVFGAADSTFARRGEQIGAATNALPLRLLLSPAANLRDWIVSIESQRKEVTEFDNVSPVSVGQWSGILDDEPIFRTCIRFVASPRELLFSAGGTQLVAQRVSHTHRREAPVELECEVGSEILLKLCMNQPVEQSGALTLLESYACLLEEMIRKSDACISELQTTSETESEKVNDAVQSAEFPGWLLHQRFEINAAKHPESPAVLFDDRTLTYGELESRANQFAHHLRSMGVTAEKIVAVLLPRCLETAIIVLGISKAGGVYLPLSPELPAQRISLLLESARPAAIISSKELLAKLPASAFVGPRVVIDDDWPRIQLQQTSPLEAKIRGENLAYIIYTSGSTGEPKGVGVPHAAAAHHIDAVARRFGYTSQDRALLFASLSFDVSIEQLLAPLVGGASVVIRGAEAWSAREFREQAARLGLTVINLTPAYWREIAEEIENVPPKIRLVIVGGDAMPADTAERWLAHSMGRTELLNAYGPTETVITATLCRVSKNSISQRYGVSIGSALPGRIPHIVDHWGQPVFQMVSGELCLAGETMARGYVDDPALTAEQFTPDPFSGVPGRRLYRTGDITRRREDGSLEYLGRTDSQVKVRGFRVELGEIEAALRAHPAVLEAVVVLHEAERRKRLVSYVVLRNPGTKIEQIREYLQNRLPDYMVPSTLTLIGSMPMMHSGKIDRKALAALPEEREKIHSRETAENPLERLLSEIWARELNLPRVGPEDDFFELGGDSLAAMSLVPSIEVALDIEIPLRALFDAPTVRQLARFLETLKKPVESNERPPLRRAKRDRTGEFPLTFSQERLFVLNQLRSQAGFYNVSGGIRLSGRLDTNALQRTLTELVRRHEALRTIFRSTGSSVVQKVQEPSPVILDTVDLSADGAIQAEKDLQRLTQEEALRPVDLKMGPIFRSKLFTLASEDHVLWLTTHHIVSDGHSLSLILREFCTLYEAFSQGLESTLEEPPIQLADYACWQREWLSEERLAPHLDYWKKQLRACPIPARLPMEKEGNGSGYSGSTLVRTIHGDLPDRLQKFCQQHSVTAFMTLLAAWKTLLFSYSEEEDVVVGNHVINRGQKETDLTVGFLANVLVVRTNLAGDPSFAELAARVKEVVLQGFEHECVPFERLVEELQPNYASGETPLFKSFFAMQGPLLEVPSTPELQMSLIEPEERSAKFDLTLFAAATESEIRLAMNYRQSRFASETIAGMMSAFEALLDAALSDHELRLSALIAEVQRRNRDKWSALREESMRRLLAGSSR